MSYYYKKYEWSAFTEADLLKNGKNGCDFGKGDTFVAGSPTTTLSTYDNDSKLSGGDTWWCKTWAEDKTGQDGYVNGCRVGCQMYAEQYHTLKGSDGKTYYLMEIKIEGHDSAGAGNGYFTYYGAQPPAGTSLTVTGTCSVDGSWIDYSCLGAGKTAPPNTPPTFTNIPSNGVFCVNENTKLVIDLNASDKDCDALSFSIAGGADGSKFTIDAKTGVLSFVTAPDYEKPTDSDGNNSYKVIVQVADGKGGTAVKELTVNVCDVKEDTPKCVVIEAEDMKLSCYTVKCATSASGGEYISLTGSSGSASTTFKGAAGEYDLQLRYWDTSGDGNIKVYVNGCLAGTVRLNANDSAWHEITLEDLNLKKGDVITLKGDGKGCENAIIDKIKICPTNPEPEPVKPGALEGRVFVDANKDGIDNGEAGVGGVTVQLLNAAGAVVATMVTAADGSYRFDGLVQGTYSVVFPTEVDGKVLTDANVGGDDTIDSDANVTTGQTGNYAVTSGNITKDVDAGIKDPGTAAIEGRIFVDANGDAVDNDEAGVEGVTVKLLNASGAVVATTVTTADGSYLFEGLDAGDYVVQFPTSVDGKVLVDANVGGDDTIDSDANPATGKTGTISVSVGEISSDNDAGLVSTNVAPDAVDDVAGTCAIVARTVDVLANDTDADGDLLTITQVGGQAIVEGGSVDVEGVTVSLVGGKLVVDGSAAYADLLIGQKAQLDISYTVSDGKGGFDTANLDMDFCGAKNTLETIKASLPEGGNLVLSRDGSFGGDFYGVTISGTGDERFDGKTFDSVYCVSAYEAINPDVNVPYTFYLADQASVPAGVVKYPANLDMVNWILNQDFTSQDNGDGTGQTYTEAEIQGAIWGLTDNIVFVNSSLGTNANAQEIYNEALAYGEGFVAGEGDIVGLILDPTAAAEAAGNKQPLIVGIDWDDLAQDCLCY